MYRPNHGSRSRQVESRTSTKTGPPPPGGTEPAPAKTTAITGAQATAFAKTHHPARRTYRRSTSHCGKPSTGPSRKPITKARP